VGAIEEFPPYDLAIDEGERLFKTPFKNGQTYADCFPNGGIGIRQNYPYFDAKSGTVKTLEQEINECRVKNGEDPLPWAKGKIASISAFMAYTSRGKPLNIVVPSGTSVARDTSTPSAVSSTCPAQTVTSTLPA
jgi:sulfur-oxidizing protein SoxA